MGKTGKITEAPAGGVQVINRVADILDALSMQTNGLSLGAIAQAVDLPRSTVQRLVGTLEAIGYVRVEGAGGIRLGPGILRLTTAAHADLVSVARPLLQKLSDAVEETVILSRPSKLQLVVEYRVLADRELQVAPRLGATNMPIHKTSAGRSLLALDTDEEVREALAAFRPQRDEDAVEIDDLLVRLADIRAKGFACDNDELMEGITTMAVAFNSLFGRFAVSLPVPTIRFRKHKDLYFRELLAAKAGLLKAFELTR